MAHDPDWSFLAHLAGRDKLGEVIVGMLERDPKKRWDVSRFGVSWRFTLFQVPGEKS